MQRQEVQSKVPECGRKGIWKNWLENGPIQGNPFCSVDHCNYIPIGHQEYTENCVHKFSVTCVTCTQLYTNIYTRNCNSDCPIGFLLLSPAISLGILRLKLNLMNHKLRKCTWRSHSTHDLNVH